MADESSVPVTNIIASFYAQTHADLVQYRSAKQESSEGNPTQSLKLLTASLQNRTYILLMSAKKKKETTPSFIV